MRPASAFFTGSSTVMRRAPASARAGDGRGADPAVADPGPCQSSGKWGAAAPLVSGLAPRPAAAARLPSSAPGSWRLRLWQGLIQFQPDRQ